MLSQTSDKSRLNWIDVERNPGLAIRKQFADEVIKREDLTRRKNNIVKYSKWYI